MDRTDYESQINDLKATVGWLLDIIDKFRLTLESVNAINKRNEELVKKLSAEINEYQSLIKVIKDK